MVKVAPDVSKNNHCIVRLSVAFDASDVVEIRGWSCLKDPMPPVLRLRHVQQMWRMVYVGRMLPVAHEVTFLPSQLVEGCINMTIGAAVAW